MDIPLLPKIVLDRNHDLPHIRMGSFSRPQSKDPLEFFRRGRDDDSRLQLIRQNRPGHFRSRASLEQGKVIILCLLERKIVKALMGSIVQRLNKSQLIAEFVFGVVAVARRFLSVRSQAVADEFMGHAAVCDNLQSNEKDLAADRFFKREDFFFVQKDSLALDTSRRK